MSNAGSICTYNSFNQNNRSAWSFVRSYDKYVFKYRISSAAFNQSTSYFVQSASLFYGFVITNRWLINQKWTISLSLRDVNVNMTEPNGKKGPSDTDIAGYLQPKSVVLRSNFTLAQLKFKADTQQPKCFGIFVFFFLRMQSPFKKCWAPKYLPAFVPSLLLLPMFSSHTHTHFCSFACASASIAHFHACLLI